MDCRRSSSLADSGSRGDPKFASASRGESDNSTLLPQSGQLHVQLISKSRRHTLRKEFGLFTNIAAILNLVLGSGIFITPASILAHSKSLGLSLILWIVGGVISICGALCFLEMALMVKKSGSTYIFIKEAYSLGRRKPWMEQFGSFCGFVVAWIDIVVLQPLTFAIVALALGRYTCRPFFIECDEVPVYAVKMLALFWSSFVLIINIFSVKIAARFLDIISSLKLVVLAVVVITALSRIIQHGGFPVAFKHPFLGSSTSWSSIALGLYGVTYAYDGWDAGLMVQEETKNASKNLRRALFFAIPVITVTFVLVNISFFSVLSYSQILEAESVGLTFGYAVLGDPGLVAICVMVVIMMLGGLHGNLIDSSRELLVCSREGSLPRFLSGVHLTLKTPVIALIFEVLLADVLIMIGSIQNFVDAFNALEWLTYGAVFFGLIVMRVAEPDRPRPFKVLLFFPSLMVVVSILLVFLPLWQNPFPQLMGFAASSLAIPLYCFFVIKLPCKVRPKIIDRISKWLIVTSSKIFNTQVHSKI